MHYACMFRYLNVFTNIFQKAYLHMMYNHHPYTEHLSQQGTHKLFPGKYPDKETHGPLYV